MASYYGATDAKGYRLRLDIGAITQDVNLNQSSFPWSLYLECGLNYFQTFASTFSLVLDGTTVFSTTTQVVSLPGVNSSVLLCSGNKTVDHNSDGTKSVSFNGSFRVNSVQSYTPQGTLTVPGSFALATIPRAALLNSFADFQIETTAGAINGNLTIYSASFNHTIDLLKNGSIVASWAIAAGPVGSYNFALTLSAAQRDTIFNGMPNAESATFTLVVKTFNGATQIGSDQSRTATGTIPTSYKPSITTSNSGYSWTNKNNKLPLYLIQNVSTLSLQLVGGSAPTGATLSEYKVRFGSITRQGSYSGLTISENVGLITSYGTLYAYYSVKDSRGRWSNEISESLIGNSLNVRQYSPPVSNGFDVIRNTTLPTSADYILKFANSLYSIGNTWTYTLQYWNGSGWALAKAATAIAAASINSIFTHALPYSESSVYSVKAILTDQFNTVEFTDDLPTSAFPLSYGSRGIGVGKDTSDTYDLEVGTGGISSDGSISITGSVLQSGNVNARFNAIAIASDGEDLNNYQTPGMFYCASSARAATLSNCPTTYAFSLFVEYHAGRKQTLTVYATNNISTWVRNLYGGIWGTWYQLWNNTGIAANANLLDGINSGNDANEIPISNGAVNTNLNADLLDGHHWSELNPAWTAITPSGGWTNVAGTTFAGRKMPDGSLQLKGQLTGGTKTDATIIGTLPVALRLPYLVAVPQSNSGALNGLIWVQADGVVKIYGMSTGGASIYISAVLIPPTT